jgi:cytochrome c553
MMAVKSGARDNGQTALMKGVIASVKPAEIKAIAKWLASLESEAADNINLQTPGAKLYLEQSCHGCHGVDAQTPLLTSYPKLAGQNQPYLMAQIKDIQSGARHHDQTEIMKPLIQSLTEEQLQTIADWLAAPGQEAAPPVTPPELDGKQLYSDKGCTACHGAEGNQPLQPNYPVVAGQAEDYLVTQMMAVKSGARDNGQTALMKGIIASVKPAEIKAIAKWLASLESSEAAGNVNLQTPGAKLYLEQSCHGCHGVDAQTPLLASYPKLAGQNQPYLVAQIKDIQSGARHHDQTEIMKPLVQSLTEEQLQTIADWLAAIDNQVEEDTKLNSVVSDK